MTEERARSSSRLALPLPLRQAWTFVVLLAVAYAISFADRYTPALLTADIKADLGLTDSQIGLLMGAGFAALYAAAGIPIATALDRGNRKAIVCAGIAFWSLMTLASGFATSFLSSAAVSRGRGDWRSRTQSRRHFVDRRSLPA